MNKLFFLSISIFLFFTCQSETALKNPPKVGQYYVFDGLLEDLEIYGEQVLKVSEVSSKEVTFLIPKIELAFEYDATKDQKLTKEQDEKGNMYGTKTIVVSKNDLAKYEQNFEEDLAGILVVDVFE